MDKRKLEAMVTKFLEKLAIIMLKKHRKFWRSGLTHLDATPIVQIHMRHPVHISLVRLCSFQGSCSFFNQGVSCDRFFGRTHAPRTSRLRCARTRVRTPNFKRSHFAPALQSFFINFSNFFQQFFSIFMV